MNATVIPINGQSGWLGELLSKFPLAKFSPLAYYDKHLDCIRVIIRECSVTEHRLTAVMTVLEDNYPDDGQQPYVGFVIKGVQHLFESMNLPLDGVMRVTDLFHRIATTCPDQLVDSVLAPYQSLLQVLQETELEVDFAEAA